MDNMPPDATEDVASLDELAARYRIRLSSLYNKMSADRKAGIDVPKPVGSVREGRHGGPTQLYKVEEFDAYRERSDSQAPMRARKKRPPEGSKMSGMGNESGASSELSDAILDAIAGDVQVALQSGFPLGAILNFSRLAVHARSEDGREAILKAMREALDTWGAGLEQVTD